MEGKSLEELERISKDSSFYSLEKRFLALNEIEKRGELSQELKKMKVSFDSSEKTYKKQEWISGSNNITDDESSPLLYRPKVLYVFSVLFSFLICAVLLAMNFYRIEKKRLGLITIGIGAVFTFIVVYVASIYKGAELTILLNFIFGVILIEFLWKKNVDNDLKYRKRKIVFPLIISIAISAIAIYFMILGNQ